MAILRFLRTIIHWIIGVAVILLAVIIATANRQDVTLSLSPLPVEATLPLYAVIFSGICIGIILGLAVGAWSVARRRRKRQGQTEAPAPAPGTQARIK